MYKQSASWDLDILKEAVINGSLNYEMGYCWSPAVFSHGAYYGNVECLKYAHENGCNWSKEGPLTSCFGNMKTLCDFFSYWNESYIKIDYIIIKKALFMIKFSDSDFKFGQSIDQYC